MAASNVNYRKPLCCPHAEETQGARTERAKGASPMRLEQRPKGIHTEHKRHRAARSVQRRKAKTAKRKGGERRRKLNSLTSTRLTTLLKIPSVACMHGDLSSRALWPSGIPTRVPAQRRTGGGRRRRRGRVNGRSIE